MVKHSPKILLACCSLNICSATCQLEVFFAHLADPAVGNSPLVLLQMDPDCVSWRQDAALLWPSLPLVHGAAGMQDLGQLQQHKGRL